MMLTKSSCAAACSTAGQLLQCMVSDGSGLAGMRLCKAGSICQTSLLQLRDSPPGQISQQRANQQDSRSKIQSGHTRLSNDIPMRSLKSAAQHTLSGAAL